MNSDKTLVASQKTMIYQRDKLTDKIQFLFPLAYENTNISACIPVLKYTDQGNEPHSEILQQDKELYKNMIRCVFPIDTDITRFAGDVKFHITFLYLDIETKIQDEAFSTSEYILTVNPLSDIFGFTPDSALSAVDQKLLELEAKLQAADKMVDAVYTNIPDDIVRDGDHIKLSVNDKPTGDGVEVVLPREADKLDGTPDGMLEIDDIGEIPSVPDDECNGFIELGDLDLPVSSPSTASEFVEI